MNHYGFIGQYRHSKWAVLSRKARGGGFYHPEDCLLMLTLLYLLPIEQVNASLSAHTRRSPLTRTPAPPWAVSGTSSARTTTGETFAWWATPHLANIRTWVVLFRETYNASRIHNYSIVRIFHTQGQAELKRLGIHSNKPNPILQRRVKSR